MSDGQKDIRSQVAVLMKPDLVVTDEQYVENQKKIEQLKQLVTSMEENNKAGRQRHLEQELRRRVEEGERAKSVYRDRRIAPLLRRTLL